MNRPQIALYGIAVAAVALAIYRDEAQPPVYGTPSVYRIERRLDDEGRDRVYLHVDVVKLRNCDLESGHGPLWVDFNDPSDASTPPPSLFFRPDGTQAGRTVGDTGDTIPLRGYSAIVPLKLAGSDGSWTVRVPCQLWTLVPTGEKAWGRKVTASFGPLPLPKRGHTLTDIGGVPMEQVLHWSAT